jgi:hypothetical protein
MLQHRPNIPTGSHNPAPAYSSEEIRPVSLRRDTVPKPGLLELGLRGGVFFVIAVYIVGVTVERYAPEDLKPSTILGAIEGNKEAVALRTKLAETQATIAAQNEENARMQQEIENYRARMERVTEAYRTIYQRTNIMAQAMANVQQQYLVMRQQLAAQSQEGKVGIANLADWVAALGMVAGDPKLAQGALETGSAFRNQAMREVDQTMKQGVAEVSADAWRDGLPDPAEIMVLEDRAAPMAPEPRKAPPKKPKSYQN